MCNCVGRGHIHPLQLLHVVRARFLFLNITHFQYGSLMLKTSTSKRLFFFMVNKINDLGVFLCLKVIILGHSPHLPI